MYCNIFDSFCLKKYTSKEKKEPMVIENSIFKQILRVSDNNPSRSIGIDIGNATTTTSIFEKE